MGTFKKLKSWTLRRYTSIVHSVAITHAIGGPLRVARLIGASKPVTVNHDLVYVRMRFGSPCGKKNTKIFIHQDHTIYGGLCELGSWAYRDCVFLTNGAKQDSVLLDLGANVGLMSLQFLNLTQQYNLRAILVEPMPSEGYAIKQNFQNKNYRLNNVALTDFDGTSQFYVRDGNRGNSSLNKNRMRREDYSEVTVNTLSVESFVSQLDLLDHESIILKCDLEGSDASVLSKLPTTLWDRVSRGVIEVWSHKEISALDVEELMQKIKDYKLSFDPNFKKLISHNDLAKFWTGGADQSKDLYIIRSGQ